MNVRGGWLQFSLRTLFVVITALAVWIGVIANRARQQREAVNAIEALGGTVQYDWQNRSQIWINPKDTTFSHRFYPESHGSGVGAWFKQLFEKVEVVYFFDFDPSPESDFRIREAIPRLKLLRGLKRVEVPVPGSEEIIDELKVALPECDVI